MAGRQPTFTALQTFWEAPDADAQQEQERRRREHITVGEFAQAGFSPSYYQGLAHFRGPDGAWVPAHGFEGMVPVGVYASRQGVAHGCAATPGAFSGGGAGPDALATWWEDGVSQPSQAALSAGRTPRAGGAQHETPDEEMRGAARSRAGASASGSAQRGGAAARSRTDKLKPVAPGSEACSGSDKKKKMKRLQRAGIKAEHAASSEGATWKTWAWRTR